MKKTIFLISLISILSCSKESRIQGNLSDYVEKNFHDPDSYELIELKFIDTISEGSAANYMIEVHQNTIDNNKKYIKEKNQEISDEALSAFMGGPGFGAMSAVKELKERKEELKKYEDTITMQQSEIKKFEKYTASDKALFTRFRHQFRAKDEAGNLKNIIDTISVDMDENILGDYYNYVLEKLK